MCILKTLNIFGLLFVRCPKVPAKTIHLKRLHM
jgi:hypothetical protein